MTFTAFVNFVDLSGLFTAIFNKFNGSHYVTKYTTRFTTIEVKVERLFLSLNKSLTRTDRKFVYSRNSSLNARIDCDRFAFRSLVFHVLHRFVFLSTFLRSLPSSFSLSSITLSYAGASQTLAGILRYTPSSSFVLSFTPTFHRAQPSNELLLSF